MLRHNLFADWSELLFIVFNQHILCSRYERGELQLRIVIITAMTNRGSTNRNLSQPRLFHSKHSLIKQLFLALSLFMWHYRFIH